MAVTVCVIGLQGLNDQAQQLEIRGRRGRGSLAGSGGSHLAVRSVCYYWGDGDDRRGVEHTTGWSRVLVVYTRPGRHYNRLFYYALVMARPYRICASLRGAKVLRR